MNYYSIRWILVILSFIIFFKTQKYYLKENTLTNFIIKICLFLIIYACIWGIKFEKQSIKFKTVEQYFHYYYPTEGLKKSYIYENYAYIFYEDDGFNKIISMIKENGTWKLDKGIKESKRNYKEYIIHISENSLKNSAIVVISGIMDECSAIQITDTLSSSFDIIKLKDNVSNGKTYISEITFINQRLDKNYTIFIDGEEYKPF